MRITYFSKFVIGLNHNEGVSGLTFRLTLGVMLVYASIEAGLLAGIKHEGQADRDIFTDWQVKRYARKLARKSAMADLDSTSRMRQIDREAIEKVYVLQKSRQTDDQIRSIEAWNILDAANGVETAKPAPSENSLDRANRKRHRSKQQALDKMQEILSVNPAMGPPEIAARIGKSRQTVYDYFNELEAAGKLHRNGSVKIIR